MAWLALDDTDTPDGGCTTYTAWRLAQAIDGARGPLAAWRVEWPLRLVRLAPTIPAKTRGNGALVIPLAHDAEGRTPGDAPPEACTPDALDALRMLVADHLPSPAAGDADPQPGAVLGARAPDAALYRRAVAGPVTPEEAWAAAAPGTVRLTGTPRRGETGALAAAAWPMTHRTFEAIVYRDLTGVPSEAPRRLAPDAAQAIRALRGGFDNHDPATGRVRCVPRTPCPVLVGVRGTDPEALERLRARIVEVQAAAARDPSLDATPATGGQLVVTNHATGDHARHARTRLGPHRVVRLDVTIQGGPARRRGGHLFVPAEVAAGPDHGAGLTLAAFEPTKGLRDGVERLAVGDRLMVLGRIGDDTGTVALEAFRVTEAVARTPSAPNPVCTGCGRRMKSAGRDAGYRCRPCGTRVPGADPVAPEGPCAPGAVHQVPDHVRGHLLPPAGGLPAASPPVADVGHWLRPAGEDDAEPASVHSCSAIARTTS